MALGSTYQCKKCKLIHRYSKCSICSKKWKIGKATKLQNLCRELRIQMPSTVGAVYDGFNTITHEKEYWQVIKVNKDYNDNILRRIYKED